MGFVPYLHFQGDCAAAMRFYKEVFGGELELMTYAEAPEGTAPPGIPASDRILHSQLKDGDSILMASDFPPGWGDAQKAVSIARECGDVETARARFERLLDGGEVIMPFGKTFFSEAFGMVRDRFGTHWMITA